MDLLFSNDRQGHYPESWYAATALHAQEHQPLQGEVRADVCIVGAGFTGLSAALHMAQAGLDVVVLEAHRVGFGASGRNGGQLGSGQRVDQLSLEGLIGAADARKYWDLGEEAKDLVRALVAKHGIDCQLRDGVAWCGSRPGDVAHLHEYAEHMATHYDYDMEVMDADAFRALCPSPDYCGGVLDMGAAHLHPLRLAQGLAQAAIGAGARVFERSHVRSVDEGAECVVHSAQGKVRAGHVVYAGNGYLGSLQPKVARRVMPINNFIVATEPLRTRVAEVLTRDVAVADSRHVVNYFRLSPDGRLLFGGGENYSYRFPQDIRAKVRAPMLEIFPSLRDVRLDYAWGGTLGITMKRLPLLERLRPNVLAAAGYSGHGVGTAVHAGRLLAEVVKGSSAGFDAMAALPTPPFPGGPSMRTPLLKLAMTWFALRDRLGI
ncbi:FAD-binding oxidoreductase [Salipiger sp. 1_MG-2023]|uniref:NAD(P)/FAD-dependent oxidoreductase n=1 Tax=Salipiger sp. 1_MG-2023 TaxID=3062665 RepID=UPI0026E37E90|nr:FAD-binding oxidoreductase [Salipiger sp. 1_MG-2023]MDO6583939.1 FAD-binding oxidoreductase [Salipiger sp. 1_MG-2023]